MDSLNVPKPWRLRRLKQVEVAPEGAVGEEGEANGARRHVLGLVPGPGRRLGYPAEDRLMVLKTLNPKP